ncbi:MAG: hypothetical protein H7A33_03165 [Deltaproteobacteria bacterium]|nr:hypothetical protein [Deltaproteobacteria bacterium]
MPTSKKECRDQLQKLLVQKCNVLFADAAKAEQKKACLANLETGLKTCDQFFGNENDFCANCTNGCISNYDEANPQRKECLQMCLTHKGCS